MKGKNEWMLINLPWIVWRTDGFWINCGCIVWITCGVAEAICTNWPVCACWFGMICNCCGCWISCYGWGCWITCNGCGCWMICNGWGCGCWIITLVARWRDVCGTLTIDGEFDVADNGLKTGIWLMMVGCKVDEQLSTQTNCCCDDGVTVCWIMLLLFDEQR